MPVRMKTMTPVTLCSLVRMSTQSGVTWETLGDQSQPPQLICWTRSLLCPMLWTHKIPLLGFALQPKAQMTWLGKAGSTRPAPGCCEGARCGQYEAGP